MKNIVITGGAGFIGTNSANYFSKKGYTITIFDNLSRTGSKLNLKWLKKNIPQLKFVEGDIRDYKAVEKVLRNKDITLHLAGQVAVTTSVKNPRDDFEHNALGTLNVLEAVRILGQKTIIINSSTNKIYGGLDNLRIKEKKSRYAFSDLKYGISEEQQVDFHSPYGCSKGAADQYVRDYARIYGLNTIVFRQSCIYGPHQFGMEDQGWVAWFIIALLRNTPITVYGTGKQVRDILYIDDLCKAYELAIKNIHKTKGQIYNIGGGIENTISIWHEFRPILEELFGRKITVSFSKERPGDQSIFVTDIRKAKKEFGWQPKVSAKKGIKMLHTWIYENKNLFIS